MGVKMEIYDKKRKKINVISLTMTISIILISLLSIILIKHILVVFLVVFILIFGLFGLSKFYVIPQYEKLKMSIIEKYFSNIFTNSKITKCLENRSLTKIYYNDNNYELKNVIDLNLNSLHIIIQDLIVYEKINWKDKEKVSFKAKIMHIENFNFFKEEFIAFSNSMTETNFFLQKSIDKFSNLKLSSKMFKGKQFLTNTENKDILELIGNILNITNNFSFILNKNSSFIVLYKEKKEQFEFDLKKSINEIVFDRCKESYALISKLISNIVIEREVIKDV